MKRFVTLLLVLTLLCFVLTGCKSTSYEEANNESTKDFSGYFTTVKQWGSGMEGYYYILYANDTKVMYLHYSCGYRSGITPLYNTDGTLQIYEAID